MSFVKNMIFLLSSVVNGIGLYSMEADALVAVSHKNGVVRPLPSNSKTNFLDWDDYSDDHMDIMMNRLLRFAKENELGKAVLLGDFQLTQNIFLTHTFCDTDIAQAFVLAASLNDCVVLEFFLSRRNLDEVLGEALELAAYKNNLEAVALLLQQEYVSEFEVSQMLNRAIKNDAMPLIKMVLKEKQLSDVVKFDACKIAVRLNNIVILKELLLSGLSDRYARGAIQKSAEEADKHGIVALLKEIY